MWETLKDIYPDGQCNRTDPIVRHDSKYQAGPVMTLFQPQAKGDPDGIQGQPMDSTKVDAIQYPLIRVNNHLIGDEQIKKFVLHNDRFMPYIDLIFVDSYRTIQFGDMPGLNNVVSVVLLENSLDTHRPIKLDFYTTSCKIIGDTFYMQGEFKCVELEKEHLKQEVFNWPGSGCQGKWCQLSANEHPTTYEFLHTIADKCGLGFVATQHTKEVKDDRWRILKRQKYRDAIQEAVACGGGTADNIFDCWIDPWANIVMANVKWVMDEKVKRDELATVVTSGVSSSQSLTDGLKKNEGYCHRILSNVTSYAGLHNLCILDIQKLVDLSTGYFKGTLTDYTTIYPEGVNKPDGTPAKNDLVLQQIQEVEDSLPGDKDKESYEFHATEFAGLEMAELTPTIEQKQRHNEWFKKQRAHIYKVTMNEPNFGIERGMLCWILWFSSDTVQKVESRHWQQNLLPDQDSQQLETTGEENTFLDQRELIVDNALSGLYYVDGTDWTWDPDSPNIIQHLYLIKAGEVTEFYNKENPMKVNAPS